MKHLKTWGGIAALTCAATYVFGFVVLLTLLAPSGYGSDDASPASIVAFMVENPGLMITWNFAIYVINGLALAALSVALAAHFASAAPALSQMIRTFGALWATLVVGAGMVANVGIAAVVEKYSIDPTEAVRIWEIMGLVENGLGGGNEIAGAVWAILIAIAALTTGMLSRAFAGFSALIGVSGLLTVIPQTGDIPGAVFGLGYIAWFVWVGIALLRATAPSHRGEVSPKHSEA